MPVLTQTSIPGGGIPVLSLKDYFSQNRKLVIPPWQREYSWKTTEDMQVDTLMKDLLKFLRDPEAEEYLLGSVVLCQENPESDRLLLIDGQQRTLTLTLLLMCCQKYLFTAGILNQNDVSDSMLVSDISGCLTQNPLAKLDSRVEMKREDADATLEEIYNWSKIAGEYDKTIFKNMDKKNDTQKNLVGTAEFIFREMAGNIKTGKNGQISGKPGNWLTPDEMKSAMNKLMNRVKLIEIVVTDKRESISVFDHINNRGMNLNPADLVKNLMFESVKDIEFPVISDNWEKMADTLMATKKSRLADPRYLLRAISHVEYGAHESYDNLDVFWSKRFKDHVTGAPGGIGALAFSKKLPEYASHLKSFVLREKEYKYSLSEIYLSGELGSVQHYSVMLAGVHLENKETFNQLCKQINLRTLLYMFAGEKTQLFDAMVPDWAHNVHALAPDATKADLNKVYETWALPDEKLFSSLRENMSEWDYTNASDKKKIRSVLALLSIELNAFCNKSLRIEDAMRARKVQHEMAPWEIDHIYPQSKNKVGIYQTIGNLVLLSSADNNNASDDDPHDKKAHYSESSLILTQILATLNFANTKQTERVQNLISSLGIEKIEWQLKSWDEKSIESRLDFYHKYLCHVIKNVSK